MTQFTEETIYCTLFDTPMGPMTACAGEKGLCLLEFSEGDRYDPELKTLSKRLNRKPVLKSIDLLNDLQKQLIEYFDGDRKEFNLPLDTSGSPFQQSVWEQLQTIPFGQTRSYKEQAASIGKPKAVRAVANANGMNRIAIIIPCHRVIGSDGTLTGYSGGLWRKKHLLELERGVLIR